MVKWLKRTKVVEHFSFGLLVLATSVHSIAEIPAPETSDYWSFFSQGDSLNRENLSETGVPIFIQRSTPFRLVDETTDPKNPFPDCALSLYMEPLPENTPIRMTLRPFADETPVRGWFEFNFRLVEGNFYLGIGTMKEPFNAGGGRSFAMTRLTDFTFAPDEPVKRSGGVEIATSDVSELSANENYVFRVSWELVEGDLELIFSLNGSQMTRMNGEPFTLLLKESDMDGGVLGFLIGSGSSNSPNATAFFGNILAEDLDQAR